LTFSIRKGYKRSILRRKYVGQEVGLNVIFRVIRDSLFQGRKLPAWWVRFTDHYPVVPNLIAVAGLVWITFALAQFKGIANQERGAAVESVAAISPSGTLSAQVFQLREIYRSWFPEEVRAIVAQLYYNPALYLVIPFLLLLEFLFPCDASQPLIGKGFLQDAIWFVAFAPVKILILFPIGQFLESFFDAHRQFFNIGAVAEWPVHVRVIAALFLSEFLFWCNHFVRHKLRVFWFFHAVHHSQKQINVFTDDRMHIVDSILASLLTFLPFFLFHLPNWYAVTVIALYLPIHDRFIHTNIKMNLGWLGWLITSPQFHRVHHSAAPEHLDKNFGAHLSLFDHLFGTACRNTNVYPQTGIADSQFPGENNLRWWQLPKNWLKQTVYPFVQLFEEQQLLHRGRVFVKSMRSLPGEVLRRRRRD
jgi:sterol desaturase/sphingolipid hydroxylase (fatty acid hydroxylase superfamily)